MESLRNYWHVDNVGKTRIEEDCRTREINEAYQSIREEESKQEYPPRKYPPRKYPPVRRCATFVDLSFS